MQQRLWRVVCVAVLAALLATALPLRAYATADLQSEGEEAGESGLPASETLDAGDAQADAQADSAGLLALTDLSASFKELAENAALFTESVTGEPLGVQTIANGVYYVCSASSPEYVLDVENASYDAGTNVSLWTNFGNTHQRFHITYIGDGFYKLSAVHSGQVLDVVASGTTPGTNVTQWTDSGTENQQWVIRDLGDGTYQILSRCNNLALAAASTPAEGVNVQMAEASTSDSLQAWVFEPAPAVEDGVYTIASSMDSSYLLDVVSGSTEEGANVTLWSANGNAWQRFRLEYQGDGYYSIIAIHSGQALDVVASGTENGTNVTQWGWWETDNQLWSIVENQDGSYSFISKCNGLYLDIETGMPSDGANICVNEGSGSASQSFVLERTVANITTTKSYSFTLEQMLAWQRASPYATYTDEEGLYYLDPNTFSQDDAAYYRFADLRGYSGLTAEQLDAYISSTENGRNGKLAGLGSAVVEASQLYQVNEAFIVAIAVLESGWGTSTLASGTYYNGEGFFYDTWNNDTQAWESVWVDLPAYEPGTYYNFYGIGAYDSSPIEGGVTTAIQNGWNSPAAALAGGVQWIASNYIYASSYPQETLYEMRWDPDRSEATRARGWHQYSTSLTWDVSIAEGQMSAIYKSAGYASANIGYIVPRYL